MSACQTKGRSVKTYSDYRRELNEALQSSDLESIDRVFAARPDMREKQGRRPANWMHSIALHYDAPVLRHFLTIGFDANERYGPDNISALVTAARRGRADLMQILLEAGAEMDVDFSVRNPLFAAIMQNETAAECVRLLLDAGIDPAASYKSPTMNDINAMAYALWNGLPHLAELIGRHQADADDARFAVLMADAEAGAARQRSGERRYSEWIPYSS